jgi:GH15 family glucan-1,4-alpha-glucosidase
MEATKQHWIKWLAVGSNSLGKLEGQELDSTKKSLMVIKAHIDKRGGIIASCDSSIYNYGRDYYSYVWPRDGAYAIWPLIKLGYLDEPKKFFYFCRDIMNPDGYLMHKYQPDRAIGSTWHPLLHGKHKELAIQEDETAVVVFMLGEYYKHSHDEEFIRELYETFIKPAGNFMSEFLDPQTNLPHATYDLWEEKFSTSTYTTAVVYRSLLVAADFAEKLEFPDDAFHWKEAAAKIASNARTLYSEERGLYRKGFLLNQDGSIQNDDTLDISSIYGVFKFEFPNSDELDNSVKAAENILLDRSPSGGSPRYEHDNYFASDPPFQGNPWFVTTLWLAQYYISIGEPDKARNYIKWTEDHSYPSGVLAEQINPTNGESVSVAPLVWSHAELINTILDLSVV